MKKAFTLAEVLITLGIIGVVAAITLPSLITKHRNKVYETQFKTAHSLLSQAINQLAQDALDINTSYCGTNREDSDKNIFIQDFAKYFKIIKSDFRSTGDLTALGYNKSRFNQSGPGWHDFNFDVHDNGAIFLNNGMMIASSGCWWHYTYVDFVVDTNGTKGPNKFGYDVFYFQIGDDNKLYPSVGNFYLQGDSDVLMKKCCNFKEANSCHIRVNTGSSCALYASKYITT